jgi:methanogenic corrinoid protein MtbC1
MAMPLSSAAAAIAAPHFGGVGIGRPGRIVMQVMEFADAGEAGFEHLDIGKGGNRPQFVRAHAFEEAIHDLAPGPETVVAGAASFGEPRHPALKGVAVQIAETGKADGVVFVVGRGGAPVSIAVIVPRQR